MNQPETVDLTANRNDDDENRGLSAELVQRCEEGCEAHTPAERRCAQCGKPIDGERKYCSRRCRADSENERRKVKRQSDQAGDEARSNRRTGMMIEIDWCGGPLEQELKPPAEPQELTKERIAEIEKLIIGAGRLIRACRPPLCRGRAEYETFVGSLEMMTRIPFSTLLEIANFADRRDAVERMFQACCRDSLAPEHRVRVGADSVDD